MVALKTVSSKIFGVVLRRSRNAVVALKIVLLPFLRRSFPKQERRGGIEKDLWDYSVCASAGKQERRGGIENRDAVGAVRDEESRKQERRGGIENREKTIKSLGAMGGSRNAVVALKTDPPETPRGGLNGEAGTPWWH